MVFIFLATQVNFQIFDPVISLDFEFASFLIERQLKRATVPGAQEQDGHCLVKTRDVKTDWFVNA